MLSALARLCVAAPVFLISWCCRFLGQPFGFSKGSKWDCSYTESYSHATPLAPTRLLKQGPRNSSTQAIWALISDFCSLQDVPPVSLARTSDARLLFLLWTSQHLLKGFTLSLLHLGRTRMVSRPALTYACGSPKLENAILDCGTWEVWYRTRKINLLKPLWLCRMT